MSGLLIRIQSETIIHSYKNWLLTGNEYSDQVVQPGDFKHSDYRWNLFYLILDCSKYD